MYLQERDVALIHLFYDNSFNMSKDIIVCECISPNSLNQHFHRVHNVSDTELLFSSWRHFDGINLITECKNAVSGERL